jgi:hypothetical protein
MNGSVDFLHYDQTGNIGDLLCSPRHYFDFEAERDTVIVGGGASNSFFASRARRHRAKVRVGWGIGQSWRFDEPPGFLKMSLSHLKRRFCYDRVSTRDPSLVTPALPLVPCVSVFHPVTEIPCGEDVGVFLNANKRVSGQMAADTSALEDAYQRPIIRAINVGDVGKFTDAFRQTKLLITNSYHAAYWGLLSGRQVHVIGYSSKFANLVALFGLGAERVIAVERGNVEELERAILGCVNREPLHCADPSGARNRFRSLNLDFAGNLETLGIRARVQG